MKHAFKLFFATTFLFSACNSDGGLMGLFSSEEKETPQAESFAPSEGSVPIVPAGNSIQNPPRTVQQPAVENTVDKEMETKVCTELYHWGIQLMLDTTKRQDHKPDGISGIAITFDDIESKIGYKASNNSGVTSTAKSWQAKQLKSIKDQSKYNCDPSLPVYHDLISRSFDAIYPHTMYNKETATLKDLMPEKSTVYEVYTYWLLFKIEINLSDILNDIENKVKAPGYQHPTLSIPSSLTQAPAKSTENNKYSLNSIRPIDLFPSYQIDEKFTSSILQMMAQVKIEMGRDDKISTENKLLKPCIQSLYSCFNDIEDYYLESVFSIVRVMLAYSAIIASKDYIPNNNKSIINFTIMMTSMVYIYYSQSDNLTESPIGRKIARTSLDSRTKQRLILSIAMRQTLYALQEILEIEESKTLKKELNKINDSTVDVLDLITFDDKPGYVNWNKYKK